jgi:hypothetical protein
VQLQSWHAMLCRLELPLHLCHVVMPENPPCVAEDWTPLRLPRPGNAQARHDSRLDTHCDSHSVSVAHQEQMYARLVAFVLACADLVLQPSVTCGRYGRVQDLITMANLSIPIMHHILTKEFAQKPGGGLKQVRAGGGQDHMGRVLLCSTSTPSEAPEAV